MENTLTPREHIESIRKTKFSIGGEPNPLTEDLHQSVKNLSAELYAKDVHFLMEIIQNAEDNMYSDGVKPSLEFLVTSRDITGTGAPSTLLVFNNEKGFSAKNIESICSVGRSTKKGQRQRGYIGEKGIGFKSVFLITDYPYIFSNGYQIRFDKEPCPHCKLGYIVPEWVEDNPTLQDIQNLYGSAALLPATTIVLPLKADKEQVVKLQLSNIHPEVLLFLAKIRRLSVREDNEDCKLNTVNAISISSETDFVTRKNVGAESYTLHLSADEDLDGGEKECSYYIWKQKFPVNHANREERRMEIDELVITLAFPIGKRLNRGMDSPGIYAFLPTEMVTNFPFVVQADFLLASSRETILLDSKWNQGILNCVPSAFVNAFISLLKTSGAAPVSSLSSMFQFLPVDSSAYPKLNVVRDSIKSRLLKENIMPSESYTEQKFFHKPSEVGRIMPSFWDILVKAREQGVNLDNLSSHGLHALNSAFDKEYYDEILDFLEVRSMDNEWYAKCIQSSNLVLGLLEDDYLQLLFFIAEKWSSHFQYTTMKNVPLLKYVIHDGYSQLCGVNEAKNWVHKKLQLSYDSRHISWLIDWNKEFRCSACFFMPRNTQESLRSFHGNQTVMTWLSKHVEASFVTVNEYAILLKNSLEKDRRLVVAFASFICQSLSKKYVSQEEVKSLCRNMLLVDNYGCVVTRGGGVLVPANGSRWVKLIGSNPWRRNDFVELGEDYLRGGNFAGVITSETQLISFLKNQIGASDIPDVFPPDEGFSSVYSPLTKENTFLLLDWIRNLKRKGKLVEGNFLRCINQGSWLRISVGDSLGYRPPSQSFLLTSEWGNLLSSGSELVDIPLIDEQFYGSNIISYKEELMAVGVMADFGAACKFIGKHLMSLAANRNLTRGNVFSILKFIRFLREKFLPPDEFIKSIKEGQWLRTSHGEKSPVGSILYNAEWTAASKICNLPFVDQEYYGEGILKFREELQLLGVLVGFDRNYQRLADCFRMPSSFTSLTVGDVVLILDCIRHTSSSNKIIGLMKDKRWLKTDLGYRSPNECFLFDPEWGILLVIFSGFPLIDENLYGKTVFSYKAELRTLGVVVSFEDAVKAFVREFKRLTSLHSLSKEDVLSFLKCYRNLKKTPIVFPSEFHDCIHDQKWMMTRLGPKSPRECILFSSDWEHISQIALLPFIDDSEKCYGTDIREFEEELKEIHVVTKINKGARFVASGLSICQNPTDITPSSVLSLFECIRNILKEQGDILTKDLLGRLNKRWLRTNMGYRAPNECFLYGSDWKSLLQCEDATFIDEKFYGFDLSVYKKELNAIGVTVDTGKGCDLLASLLEYHSQFDVISRIYTYLSKYEWKPQRKVANWIWIPNGSNNGQWVCPEECVLFDKDGLFSLQLKVLEKHYDRKLLTFFSMSLGVRHNPSVDDYCRLWKTWEDSGCQLTRTECCAFWGCMIRHWNTKTKDHLAGMLKLPVNTDSEVIQLVDKENVFIPDDLLLMDLFEKASPYPIFAWYPQPSVASVPRTKLYEIYSSIGVRPISKAVQKIESFNLDGEYKQVDPGEMLIKRDLIKLILGFLSDPSVDMDSGKRQETVRPLVDVKVCEAVEPICVRYSLSLSSVGNVDVEASQLIRWERHASKMFFQKIDRSSGHKANYEFATNFSRVIAEGLLWEKEDRIGELYELIKLGWLVEFDEETIGFLLKTKNLQVFMEDVEFLESSFSPA